MQNYSFFGTCANDFFHTQGVLKTIVKQTIHPIEVILIDSGDTNQFDKLNLLFNNSNIKLVYFFKKLSRVEALNFAIDQVSTSYCMRFDTRSRFSSNYAEESLKLLLDKNLQSPFVGGVPKVIPEKSSAMAKVCSNILERSYIFFYPRHRQIGYSGKSSSIYLGSFKTSILKSIKYRDNAYLISEDSLLAADFSLQKHLLWISSNVKLNYVSRSSLLNILRLFNTYGYCRFNTILSSGKIHSKKRYFYLSSLIILYLLISFKLFPYNIFFLPIMFLILNIFGEIFYKKISKNIIYPILGLICQMSWIIGFMWGAIVFFKLKKNKTNFIK